MYRTLVAIHVVGLSLVDRIADRAVHLLERTRRSRTDGGQSTAEYALVLLGAASVALVFIAWASRTDRIGKLFNAVVDTVIGKV